MPKRGLNDGKKLKDQVPSSNMEDARWKRCYHKVSTLKADKKKLLDAFVKEKGADYLCKKGNLNDFREFLSTGGVNGAFIEYCGTFQHQKFER